MRYAAIIMRDFGFRCIYDDASRVEWPAYRGMMGSAAADRRRPFAAGSPVGVIAS